MGECLPPARAMSSTGSLPILPSGLMNAPGTERTWRTNDLWRTSSTAGFQPVVVFSANPANAAATRRGRVAMLYPPSSTAATRGALPEDLLRAVSVVDVVVDDRQSADAVRGLHVASSDRDVVDEAEAHRGSRPGVMARGPHHGEAAGLRRLDCGPCRQQRRSPTRLRRDRVRVEPVWLLQGREDVQVPGRVYTFDRGAF